MARSATRRVALMAMHPQYASAILEGRKTVEFRKRPLAPDISHVLIYATSPVKKVVGAFRVAQITFGEPREIWQRFGHVGCIDEASFDTYFSERATAYAILIRDTFALDQNSFPLSDLDPRPAIPQSFAYLDEANVYNHPWAAQLDLQPELTLVAI